MATSLSFSQASRLNNEGVMALAYGDHVTALHNLTQSIQQMKHLALHQNDSSVSTQTNALHLSAKQDFQTMEISLCRSHSPTAFFNQAILLPQNSNETRERSQVLSACVIFNLGLTHQYVGDNVKAERLYGLASKLLSNCSLSRLGLFVKMATVHNLVQIHLTNDDGDLVQQVLEDMAGLLHQNARLMDEPQIQELLIGSLLLQKPRLAPAA